jgi:hypothetical protein
MIVEEEPKDSDSATDPASKEVGSSADFTEEGHEETSVFGVRAME